MAIAAVVLLGGAAAYVHLQLLAADVTDDPRYIVDCAGTHVGATVEKIAISVNAPNGPSITLLESSSDVGGTGVTGDAAAQAAWLSELAECLDDTTPILIAFHATQTLAIDLGGFEVRVRRKFGERARVVVLSEEEVRGDAAAAEKYCQRDWGKEGAAQKPSW